MLRVIALSLLGLMGVCGELFAAPGQYYGYFTTRENYQCAGADDCRNAKIGILDIQKNSTSAVLDTTNPITMQLNATGLKLVIAKGSNDGLNRVYLDVVDTENLNIFPVVVAPNMDCTGAGSVAVATINGIETAIVPCSEGLTLYAIDKYYPAGTGERITAPADKAFYFNRALALSKDGKWLFSIGGAGGSAGVSAIKVQDLAKSDFTSLTSVVLQARTAPDGDTAAIAVRKTPSDPLPAIQYPDNYDLVVATKKSADGSGKMYVVQQRSAGLSLVPALKTPVQINATSAIALTVGDPRAIVIEPDNFTVYAVDFGVERGFDDTAATNGELLRFSVTATGNTDVKRIGLADGISGYSNGSAEVHPINVGLSPTGDQLFILETQWSRANRETNGSYSRRYVIDPKTHVLSAAIFFRINEYNAAGSGSFIGPECPSCYQPPPVVDKKTRSRASAITRIDITILLFLSSAMWYRRRRAALPKATLVKASA
ncbi:MAG: hypothetical protein AABY83_11735 [Pseudomonadota bacterium]